MTVYLNTKKSLENFKILYDSKYFIDKSAIINNLNDVINTPDRYICITRPRRFGKSSVADMLGSYYSKTFDSKNIFNTLNIKNYDSYTKHINKYNVVTINFNKIPDKNISYNEYLDLIINSLKADLKESYPTIDFKDFYTISDMFYATEEKFIFIFDEWDYIFNNHLFDDYQNHFLEFLRNILKDQPYVALAYMTGVLPIKKYSSGSSLNMFDEFTMLNDMIYGEFFGFTENEVQTLCSTQSSLSFKEISEWFNGYINEEGDRIFNPRSVVKALLNKKCKSYWTNTGSMNEVLDILKYNILEIREDIVKMVSGQEIDLVIDEEFRAGQDAPKNKKEVYSAMIILGFLSYYDGYIKIPNKELMQEFEKALADKSFGYVSEIIDNSRKMLKATKNKDTDTIEKILHDIHNSEIPILQYNDENSLSCVLTLAYLSARDTYRIEREDKSGKGYTDFSFYPKRKNDIPFIVELKKDVDPIIAIKQIKEKEYVQKFVQEHYSKNILAVAICYDSKKKEHKCIIETL